MKTPLSRPLVLEYQSVLDYLKDTYKFRKRSIPGFSYEMWATEMGFKSRSYLRSLILGQKPLQESVLPSLLAGLSLSSEETSYFILLFRLHLAPTPELKALYTRELFSVWTLKAQEITPHDISEFLSDAMIPALFTYLSFDRSSSDLETIAKDFNCEVSRMQKALRCLIWNRLVEGEVGQDGKVAYKTSAPFFKIPSAPANNHLKKFHSEGIRSSQQAVDLAPESRKLYSTFMMLDESQFKDVQGLIEDFNRRLLAVLEVDSVKEKRVYRFNQQLFPVSEKVTEGASLPARCPKGNFLNHS